MLRHTQTESNFKLEEKRAEYPAKSLSREAPEWDGLVRRSLTFLSSSLFALRFSLFVFCPRSTSRLTFLKYFA
jgi:hypothetical protein